MYEAVLLPKKKLCVEVSKACVEVNSLACILTVTFGIQS